MFSGTFDPRVAGSIPARPTNAEPRTLDHSGAGFNEPKPFGRAVVPEAASDTGRYLVSFRVLPLARPQRDIEVPVLRRAVTVSDADPPVGTDRKPVAAAVPRCVTGSGRDAAADAVLGGTRRLIPPILGRAFTPRIRCSGRGAATDAKP